MTFLARMVVSVLCITLLGCGTTRIAEDDVSIQFTLLREDVRKNSKSHFHSSGVDRSTWVM